MMERESSTKLLVKEYSQAVDKAEVEHDLVVLTENHPPMQQQEG
jgi:hypothetical protein